MRTYARIQGDTVAELFNTDQDIRELFHPELQWVECTGQDVDVGWQWSEGAGFAPAPVEPWDVAHARALEMLRSQRQTILGVLDGLQASANAECLAATLSVDPKVAAAARGFADTAMGIEAAKEALRSAPEQTLPAMKQAQSFEDMRAAAKAFYVRLVAGAPEVARVAFRDVV